MEGRITVRLPQRLINELVDIAMVERKHTSEVMREAVLTYLAKKTSK